MADCGQPPESSIITLRPGGWAKLRSAAVTPVTARSMRRSRRSIVAQTSVGRPSSRMAKPAVGLAAQGGLLGGRGGDLLLGVDAAIQLVRQAAGDEAAGRQPARGLQGAGQLRGRARPAAEHRQLAAVEGDDRHAVVRAQARQVGLDVAQDPIAPGGEHG